MDIKSIDYKARHKEPLECDVSTPYQLIQLGLYYRLRQIYELYDNEKENGMTVKQAKELKQAVIKQYEDVYTSISEYDKLVRQNGDLMAELETHNKIFAEDNRRRVAISGLMCEANKHGCEICKAIAKAYDGH